MGQTYVLLHMRLTILLVILATILTGCGAKPDASVEKRSEKENQMMKQAGGDAE